MFFFIRCTAPTAVSKQPNEVQHDSSNPLTTASSHVEETLLLLILNVLIVIIEASCVEILPRSHFFKMRETRAFTFSYETTSSASA